MTPNQGQAVSGQPVYRLIHDSFKEGIFLFRYRRHGHSGTVTTLLKELWERVRVYISVRNRRR